MLKSIIEKFAASETPPPYSRMKIAIVGDVQVGNKYSNSELHPKIIYLWKKNYDRKDSTSETFGGPSFWGKAKNSPLYSSVKCLLYMS